MSARAPGAANSDISPPALDFDDLPASQTVKWFAENPDLNPSKVATSNLNYFNAK